MAVVVPRVAVGTCSSNYSNDSSCCLGLTIKSDYTKWCVKIFVLGVCCLGIGWKSGVLRPSRDSSFVPQFNRIYSNSNSIHQSSLFYTYKLNSFYSAARIERYSIEHAVEWNYHRPYYLHDPQRRKQKHTSAPRACHMWKPSARIISDPMQAFLSEMTLYNRLLQTYQGSPVANVRKYLKNTTTTTTDTICQTLNLHPQGLGGIFTSGSLSRSPNGLLEPLYPPFGSLPTSCPELRTTTSGSSKTSSDSQPPLDFLVHDFAHQCQQLRSTSKIILVQVGYGVADEWESASTSTTTSHSHTSYTRALLQLYRKFGMPIDDIYVFDSKPLLLPTAATQDETDNTEEWISSRVLHISHRGDNVIVDTSVDTTAKSTHPWQWIRENTAKEDLILVTVQFPPRGQADPIREFALLQSLLHHGSSVSGTAPSLSFPHSNTRQWLDHLYFHPVVYMAEDEESSHAAVNNNGKHKQDEEQSSIVSTSTPLDTGRWTVQEALFLFTDLRKQGIQAHAWPE